MKLIYYICDVFTTRQFGGNPLAVMPDGSGLSAQQMQRIAREFNFSESTFILPAQHGHSCQVRIFTPSREVPFAGHPNIGTAFVLDQIGFLNADTPIVFEEEAGLVRIQQSTLSNGETTFQLAAPEHFYTGDTIPVDPVAEALSLSTDDIRIDTHLPTVASSGLAFVLVELASLGALERAKVDRSGFEKIASLGIMPDIHMYVRSHDDFDIKARMFAPFDGVNEDPATGSANCALAGLLAAHHCPPSGQFSWRILQGEKMGRPSELLASAKKHDGKVTETGVAGSAVMFSKGEIWLTD